jgi:hypothetical protein
MEQQIVIRKNDNAVIEVKYDEEQGVSGKYWVIHESKTNSGNPIIVKRIFDTETAWSDAERYANDLLSKLGFDYTQTITL